MTATAPITGLHSEAIMRVVLENPGSSYEQVRAELGPAINEQEVFNVFITLVRMDCIWGKRGISATDAVRYYATPKGVRLLDGPPPAPKVAPPQREGSELAAWVVIVVSCCIPVAWGVWMLFKRY